MVKAKKKKIVKAKVAKKVASDNSFKIIKDKTPFMTYKITDQTIYWAILFIYIFALSLWVLNLQIDTMEILNNLQLQ
ncbi:MAG TPA: hypothetical protein PLO25_00455 [Candidatus Saccharibacteria bacterium]|nr:hypothetical protein [Candidatus Saccharibacteria bacterium]